MNKRLCTVLLLASTPVWAAEGVTGIALAGDFELTIASVQAALEASNAKDSNACQQQLKHAKQQLKILVGDFSDMASRDDTMGMQFDKAMRQFKNAPAFCAPENQANSGAILQALLEKLTRFSKSIRRN